MADQDSWRSQAYRQKVIAQIEETMRKAAYPTNKTSMEMENHVYQKAKTREEYLGLVARVILHVREHNQKKEKVVAGGPGGMGVPGGPPGMPGPQQMGVRMPGQPGMQDPINALQNLTGIAPNMVQNQMGMGPQRPPFQTYQPQPGMHPQAGMAQMPPGMMPGHSGQMPGQPGMGPPPGMQPMGQPGMMHPGMGQPGMGQMGQPGMGQMGQPGMGQPGMVQPGMMQMNQPGMQQIHLQGPNAGMMQPGMGQFQNMPTMSPSGQPMGIVSSPSGIPSPSPGQMTAPSPRGAPSPSALNTPGNPNSMGPAASPSGRKTEEQAYLDKWKQLQKYIEPLKRMINKIPTNDEDRRLDLKKMKNLLDILSDSTKRMPMETLLKCEQVLERQINPPNQAMMGKPEDHMSQPLMNTVAQFINTPLLNHTLKRTFGPAVVALHGPSTRPASPPAKRKKVSEDSDGELSNVLQGEIARLDHRFKVNLDPLFHNSSKNVHLVIQLEDNNLPNVPPINVTVPENYPDGSPTCNACSDDYDATPFLQIVQKRLMSQLFSLPNRFSLTALLDTWELSVRQACAPRVK